MGIGSIIGSDPRAYVKILLVSTGSKIGENCNVRPNGSSLAMSRAAATNGGVHAYSSGYHQDSDALADLVSDGTMISQLWLAETGMRRQTTPTYGLFCKTATSSCKSGSQSATDVSFRAWARPFFVLVLFARFITSQFRWVPVGVERQILLRCIIWTNITKNE